MSLTYFKSTPRLVTAALCALGVLSFAAPVAHAQEALEFEDKGPILREKEEVIVCAPSFKEVNGECVREVFRKRQNIDFSDVGIEGEIAKPEGLYQVVIPKKKFACDTEKLTIAELEECWLKLAQKATVPPVVPEPLQQQIAKISEVARATLQCPEYKDIEDLKKEMGTILARVDRKMRPSIQEFVRDASPRDVASNQLNQTLPIACGYPEGLPDNPEDQGKLSPFAVNFFCTSETTCFLQSQKYTRKKDGQIRVGARTRKDCEQYERIPGSPWRWRLQGESCIPNSDPNSGDFTLIPAAPGVFAVIFHDKERKKTGSLGLIMAEPQFEEPEATVTPAQ